MSEFNFIHSPSKDGSNSMDHNKSYSGIPGPSIDVRVSVDGIVTVVFLVHPWIPIHTPCHSICGWRSYSGIPGPFMDG